MMKRSQRMEPVQDVLGSVERDRARDMGAAQQGLSAAEQRLQDLQQYHADYLNNFRRTATAGGNALALRDYQQFLGRLQEAIRQQQLIVEQARRGVAGSVGRWQKAAQRVKAVETVVDKWRGEERHREGRLDQKEIDERAQRKPARRTDSQEH